MSLSHLIAQLRTDDGALCWPEELADALWLASLDFFGPRAARAGESTAEAAPEGGDEGDSEETPVDEGLTEEESEDSADPSIVSEPEIPSPSAEVSLPATQHSQTPKRGGIPARMPAARALPAGRLIARSLRTLRRWMPSQVDQVIDESTTAENIAKQQIWFPTLRPARQRWLELALVLDDSRSMTLWHDTLQELQRLLTQVGAFRDVRVWWLDASRPDLITLHARPGEAPRPSARAPGELLSADGRRVVLIASDCVSSGWDSAQIGQLLGIWAARQPVALLQLLPPQLWPRTALDPGRGVSNVLAGAREPGVPNTRLHWRAWRARMSSNSAEDVKATSPTRQNVRIPTAVPIPVLTAEPESMSTWAKLVRYGASPIVPAVIFPSRARVLERAEPSPDMRHMSPRDAIMSFRAVSSALAFRLAGLLSASPLRLPVMRLVQRTLLPQSRQIHLAEVFLGGLIQIIDSVKVTDPDFVDYDFLPGVRDLLLDASFARETIQVQRTVSRYMEERLGHAFDFDAILEAPDDFDGTAVTGQNAAFARISAEVLKRLGGRYANAVARLTGKVALPIAPTLPPLTDENVFAGKLILWVVDSLRKVDREVSELQSLGSRVHHVDTTQGAFNLLAEHRYDAIICDRSLKEHSMVGIELLDRLQSRHNFTPFALFSRTAASVHIKASTRGALVCTSRFADVVSALQNIFLLGPEERLKPPPHLPERYDLQLQKYLRSHSLPPRSVREDLSDDGSIVADAEDAWRTIWQLLGVDRTSLPYEGVALAAEVFEITSGSAGVLIEGNADTLLSESEAGLLSTEERSRLVGVLGEGFPFYLPDIPAARSSHRESSAAIRSLLVIPTDPARKSGQAPLISIQALEPFSFGTRQIEWLTMLAHSFREYLAARLYRTPQGDFPANDPQLANSPPQIQGIVLLQTALRLEARARMPKWLTRSAQQRASRVLAERVEMILCLPPVDPSIMNLLQQQIRSLQKPEEELSKDRFGPLGQSAMQFAQAAANRALDLEGAQLQDDLSKCNSALRKLPQAERQWVRRLMRDDILRSSGHISPRELMNQLAPLWPEDSATPNPLPVGRRPITFVLVAGGARSRSLNPLTRTLGRALAAAGFGLITGAAQGVDQEVAEAFLERLRTWWVNPREWFLQVLRPGQSSTMGDVATVVQAESIVESLSISFERARAVVLLGGRAGTERVGRMALATNTLLLPLVETGGATRLIFGEMIEQWNRLRGPNSSPRPVGAANLAGNEPFAAVMMIPETIRRYANPQRRRDRPERISAYIASELVDNVVTINGLSDRAAIVTGCVLAEPRVIITRIPSGGEIAGTTLVQASHTNGRAHRSRRLFTLEDSAGVLVVLEVPRLLAVHGLKCSDSALRKQQRFRVGATSRYTTMVNTPMLNQLPRGLRETYASSLPSVREFALDRGFPRLMQGAPLLDEQDQVRGLLQLSEEPQAPARLVPVVDWYRRVLARCAAVDVVAAENGSSR